ncbi:MAG TPA: hypothetical protein VGO61_07580 [Steroidobacteraceae bacterium]|jgi:hypothetical protein|nr:hypothetical protein [Steroidobacteraceae bacterium]
MVPQTATAIRPAQDARVEEKIRKIRELYADAPEIGKAALEKGLPMLTQELAAPPHAQKAGRIGLRQGQVSELLVFLPFVTGGAKRLRGLLQLLEGNFRAADAVGTVHDMRFVFVDNDSKLLFATAYDGDFDPYIEDFASKIPNAMDIWLCNCEGYPGMRDPKAAADWIASHQIAAEAWYVNSPNLTAAQTRRLEHVGKAVEELLDKVG